MTTDVIKEEGYTKYNGYKQGICPCCGNTELKFAGFDIEVEEVKFYFTCPECGGAGYETYCMEFDNINIIIDD